MHFQSLYVLNILESQKIYKLAIIIETTISCLIRAESSPDPINAHIQTEIFDEIRSSIIITWRTFSGRIRPDNCKYCKDDCM